MVKLVEGNVVGQVDGDGLCVEQGDEDWEGVVVEQRDEGELGVLEGQGDDEVGVVELGKGKGDTLVWGGFLGSKWPSRLVGGVPKIHSAGWSSSWSLSSENLSQNQHVPVPVVGLEDGGKWLVSVVGQDWE